MVGSVLHHEMLLGSRRSKAYYLRWVYAGWLVIQLAALYFMYLLQYWTSQAVFGGGTPDSNLHGEFASGFVQTFVVQQMILMLLAVPVFTAGAITDEKTRGTLQYLLTTDLWSWHLIVGKLLGRVAQVALLVLTGLPVLCFIGVFGGLEPLPLFALLLVTAMAVVALGAVSMLASVWSRHTRDAVLGLYAVSGVFFVLAWWLEPALLNLLSPLYVLEPTWGGSSRASLDEFGRRLLWSSLAWGGLTVVSLALAVWRLRPAYIRQLESSGTRARNWLGVRRPPVPEDPLPWKERHVEGLAPLKTLRLIPTWLAVLVIFAVTTFSSTAIVVPYLARRVSLAELFNLLSRGDFETLASLLPWATPTGGAGPPPMPSNEFFIQSIVAMLLASLMVGIRTSGTVSGERERQTWEALLLTPMTSRQIIAGKLWGIMGASYLYVLAYAVPALALAAVGGPLPLFWTVIWLGVTWLAMYFVGAAGVWCSVRAKTSWRSLLGTLAIGYVGGTLVYLLTTPLLVVLALIILLFLFVIDRYIGTQFGLSALQGINEFFNGFKVASCIGLATIFFILARFFLADAQKWVADRERTRHWADEPKFRPTPLRKRAEKPRFYR